MSKIAYKNASHQATFRAGNAAVGWTNKEAIQAIYKKSDELTLKTGTQHNVDHIIPLKGDNVCGLHIVENLQVLTAEDNKVKGTKL